MLIAPGLHSLSQKKGGRVHAFLYEDLDGLTLFDTLYDADGKVILDYLETIRKQPSDIKRIALSHAHKSHLGGLAAIKAASGAPVLAHDWEAPIIEGKKKAQPVGFAIPKPFNAEVYGLQVALNLGFGRHTPTPVDGVLKEGSKVGSFEVLAVPGHTPGCVAFWLPEHRAIIAGDTVATWPTLDIGWPGFNLDHEQAKRSVAKLADLQAEIVCVGHGEPIRYAASAYMINLEQQNEIPLA